MNNFAAHLLRDKAPLWPARIAARCQGQSLSYAQLAANAQALGGLLLSRGLRPGDSVLLALPDSFSFLAAFLGCLWTGVIAAPLNNRLRTADYAEAVARLAPGLVLAPPGHEALDAAGSAGVPALELDDASLPGLLAGQAPPPPHPSAGDDTCVYFVTSGTTGRPKVVPHRHEDYFLVAESTGAFMEYRQDDVVLCSAKLSHAYGMFASFTLPFLVGATVVLDPDKPGPESSLRLMADEGVTVFLSVPALYTLLLLHLPEGGGALPGVRTFLASGEVLPEAVFNAWRERTGKELWQGYGSTEAMTLVIGNKPPHLVPGSAGRAIPPYGAQVLDENLRPAPSGTPGHLALHGGANMRGYLGDPEWSRKAFTPDGLLLTGDMAVERDGVFTILGRMDDMFKAGGLWVSPMRVENALLSHPAVAQCAVTGGSAAGFTLVRAHVVAKAGRAPGPDLAEALRRHAAQLLPDFMVPTDICFRDALPLTPSGKVQRFLLRQEPVAEGNNRD